MSHKIVYKIRSLNGLFYTGKYCQWHRTKGKIYSSRSNAINAIGYHFNSNSFSRDSSVWTGAELVSFKLVEEEQTSERVVDVHKKIVDRKRIRDLKSRRKLLERQLETIPKEREKLDQQLLAIERELKEL